MSVSMCSLWWGVEVCNIERLWLCCLFGSLLSLTCLLFYVCMYVCMTIWCVVFPCGFVAVPRASDEARAAQAALAKATTEKDQLERKLKRLDKAFVCTICCTNDVDVILAPCGHMLCSSW